MAAEELEAKKKFYQRKKKVPKKLDTEYSVEEVEEIDQYLFDRLQKEKIARWNWRRVMTMISIVKHLSP